MKYFISKRVCLDDKLIPAGILVENGKIVNIIIENYKSYLKEINEVEQIEVIDFGENVLMAGIVDSHVHVNEPGRTSWEGFETATKAAAAGGITTIVDMPLNSIPPTTTSENLKIKQKAAEGKIYVDVAFWGGLISGNIDELISLTNDGVVGFKCFMCPSGVEEFPCVNEQEIEEAVKVLKNSKVVLAFHAELDNQNDILGEDPSKFQTFLKSRPSEMETNAIETILKICTKYNFKCHIVHLSTADALPIVQAAKQNGVQITVETCHHYLSLKSEEIPDKATQFKCCPPIRNETNQEKLWEALKADIIDQVVSDHSPCTPDLKCMESGDFLTAWGGISSLQFGLSLFWTEARKRGFSICDINKYMSRNPSRLCGLHNSKGDLKVGLDADFVIWNPETEIEINDSIIFHKNKVTPYLGKKLYGKVLQTVVRGNIVFKNDKHCDIPQGILLKRI